MENTSFAITCDILSKNMNGQAFLNMTIREINEFHEAITTFAKAMAKNKVLVYMDDIEKYDKTLQDLNPLVQRPPKRRLVPHKTKAKKHAEQVGLFIDTALPINCEPVWMERLSGVASYF